MASKEYVARLKLTVEHLHKCSARHLGSERVTETFNDATMLSGDVESFAITGHPRAKRCYRWSQEPEEFITILEMPATKIRARSGQDGAGVSGAAGEEREGVNDQIIAGSAITAALIQVIAFRLWAKDRPIASAVLSATISASIWFSACLWVGYAMWGGKTGPIELNIGTLLLMVFELFLWSAILFPVCALTGWTCKKVSNRGSISN